ncbi:hypothetical protein, partial [Kitasatospora setae]|uniref:hypothetical protein n=1 Tax=Kitasatospora setae TaxID=2066 RepID=UPI0005277183
MRVHRSASKRNFTVLSNSLLQDRGLKCAERGLLTFLLSLPDNVRMTAADIAGHTQDSLYLIRKSLRGLTAAGYYKVAKVRIEKGRIISVQHVTDTPHQFGPGVEGPVSGPAPSLKTKKPGKEKTSLPPLPSEPEPLAREHAQAPPGAPGPAPARVPGPRRAPVDERTRQAGDLLLRVVRPQPMLRIGELEALRLAPLVLEWLDRGCTEAILAAALLTGLPTLVHNPAGLLQHRLTEKLPPSLATPPPPPPPPRPPRPPP